MLLNTAPTNLTCQSFGTWLLNNTNFATDFTYYSDISSSASARYVRRNPKTKRRRKPLYILCKIDFF